MEDELKLHVCTKNEYITYHIKWDIKEKVKCLTKNGQKLATLVFLKFKKTRIMPRPYFIFISDVMKFIHAISEI